MLSMTEIMEAWETGKSARPFYQLEADTQVGFEYRGPQSGHPSNYASIQITAISSADFSLESRAVYPPSVPLPYARQLLLAVGRAAVDELFAATWYPFRGCSLLVSDVGWDEVMSSEVAVYLAARGALSELRRNARWRMIT